MRNSIVPAVILCALLTTSRTNGGDICLDDGPSAGLCCFQGSKDWPKLDDVTNQRSEMQVDLLDIEVIGLGLVPRDDVYADVPPGTVLALAVEEPRAPVSDCSLILGSGAPDVWRSAVIHLPPTAFELNGTRLDFTCRPLGFGVSMENSAELVCAGIISARLSYASAVLNAN